jgi:enoyl-CoA hydratase/carnithine racemase
MPYKWILVETADAVTTVVLNRPDALNAWHAEMRGEVVRALQEADADAAVKAIILTGAGERAFCAGQDLSETMAFDGGADAHRWLDGWTHFYEVIRNLETPLVAALNGVAAGSAFQVSIMADVRVGHPGVRMGQPEINSGIPSTLGPWLMVDRLGLSRTVELTLSGRMMEAAEAHASGLIHYLVPAGEVMTKARAIALDLASKPPGAMRENKRRFRDITEASFRDALSAGHAMQARAFASGEPQGCMQKFFEERSRRKSA